MNIYFIAAEAIGMTQEDIADELSVMGEILGIIGGSLLHTDIRGFSGRLTGYVQAESGQAVRDVFGASDFSVTRIEFVGMAHAGQRIGSQNGCRTVDATAGNGEERSLWVHQLGLS